jgi:hypothetical protein
MSRWIDADEFLADESEAYMNAQIKLAKENADKTIDATRYINQVVHKKIQMLIADTPSIDLIRCAECKKVREDGGHANCGGYLYCRKWKTLVDEDCFCSWGERRE